MFSDIFKQLLQNSNLSAYQMSKDTGISESLISNWKSGRQLPKYDSLNTLADYFCVSGDFLLGRTNEMQKSVKKQEEQPEKEYTKSKIIPLYMTRTSAGTGSLLFDETPIEYINVPKTDITSKADFMLEVKGDSMQPKFFDGDRVLVKNSESIYEGEIGVFILNGESYIKKMGRNELISLNPAYKPIKLTEYDDIRCAGKVLGALDAQ
ncbi:MAG: XRE family transcriptional regulator [Ruminococcus bromii]|nr:XRE family transcriptional regulator [Ruminococcus bromii]